MTFNAGIFHDIPEDEYLAEPDAFGSSRLAEYLRAPRRYKAKYVERVGFVEDADEDTDTKWTRLGDAVDRNLQGSRDWEPQVVIAPEDLLSSDGHLRSKAAREWREQQIEAGFQVIVPGAKLDNDPRVFTEKVDYLTDVIREHPEVMRIIGESKPQVTLRLKHKSGLKIQQRPDWMSDSDLLDVKVTSKPWRSWANDILFYQPRLLIQAALCVTMAKKCDGKERTFHWVVVNGWSLDVRFVSIDPLEIAMGWEKARNAIDGIANSRWRVDRGTLAETLEQVKEDD